jgi:hypothetical protein
MPLSPTVLDLALPISPATGLALLRLLPLLSSTASLTHAYMERLTTSAFLNPAPLDSAISRGLIGDAAPAPAQSDQLEVERAKESVVPAWFTSFFNKGIWSVVGLNTITLFSAGTNLLFYKAGLSGRKVWYQAGLVAAVAHYAFVPLVGSSVRELVRMAAGRCEDESSVVKKKERGGKAVELVREWVGWHTVRMCTVDVCAWGCFVAGVVGVFTEEV